MALARADDRAGSGGRRALLLGPAGLRQLRAAALALALAASLAATGCAQLGEGGVTQEGHARVADVTDGDTIELAGVGKVRLIGIDTPEVYGGVECYGRAASAFTKRLLPVGRRVRYRLGIESRDRYGRALAYVWLHDGTFVNALIAERGYATQLTIPPNVEHAHEFAAATRRARREERGLWADAACAEENR